MRRLGGKIAIVTGAGGGMGRAGASLFAKEGAKVIVADFVPETGEETVRMIKEAGGEATFVEADVSQTEDVKKIVKAAVDTYGKLNVLYNNAGIVTGYVPTLEWTEENYDKTMAVNVKGVWLGMKYAIPEMIKAGGGSIINAASIAADAAQRGSCIYAASKGAVLSMSRVVAVEHAAQNIRVNCIKPGVIATPMALGVLKGSPEARKRIERETPQGRLGKPEEVAQLALFLASDESSHITGQSLAVDGGIEADSHVI
jgi:NAD(P)-dependent dehydrogenase (short-subunit alcohol dehydrogenase family)